MNIKLEYLFTDLDGPILDGKARHYQCYKDILTKDGGQPLEIEKYWQMKRAKIRRDVMLKESNYQGEYHQFYAQWVENIEKKEYLKLDILKPKIVETLLQWKIVADKIVLVTMRQNKEHLIWQLKQLEVYHLFDAVITCNPSENEAKYKALKDLNFKRALFIGDTEEDINTAKALGIHSIAVTNGLRLPQFLDANHFVEEVWQLDLRCILVN